MRNRRLRCARYDFYFKNSICEHIKMVENEILLNKKCDNNYESYLTRVCKDESFIIFAAVKDLLFY